MNFSQVRADLHIHTCLSPCGELEMTPTAIVQTCLKKELEIIAICDHNTAGNVVGVQKAAEGSSLTVLAGMEISTSEEVHVMAIFDHADQSAKMQEIVYTHLIPGENNDDLFGMQVIANEKDEVESIEKRLLIGGTTLSLDQVIDLVHENGGLAVPSHIDRESYSLLGQLGMIPSNLAADALDVSWRGDLSTLMKIPGVDRFPIVRSSDAHRLNEIGRMTVTLHIAEKSIAEIQKAFAGLEGRQIISE